MKEASFFVFFFYQDKNIESIIFLLKAPYFFLKRDLFLKGKFLLFALLSC